MPVRHTLRLSVLAVIAAMVGRTLGAQSTLPDSTQRRIDAVFSRYGSLDAPGCALGVFQGGRIVMAKGYGAANIEYAVPLTPSTPMIMGSVSKQFTAASIALLVQDGRISLERRYPKILARASRLRQEDHDRQSRAPHERPARLLGAGRGGGHAARRRLHRR